MIRLRLTLLSSNMPEEHMIKKNPDSISREINIKNNKRYSNAKVGLTTLVVLGDAPWCMRAWTMFSWPMKAATWMGVRPDCRHTNTVIWAEEATRRLNENVGKEPNLRHGLDGRPVFEQELHHLRSVLLAGDVQRRETVLHTQTHTKRERVTQGLWLAPRSLIGGWRGSNDLAGNGRVEPRHVSGRPQGWMFSVFSTAVWMEFFLNPLHDLSSVATSLKASTFSPHHIVPAGSASLKFGNFLLSHKWQTAVAYWDFISFIQIQEFITLYLNKSEFN